MIVLNFQKELIFQNIYRMMLIKVLNTYIVYIGNNNIILIYKIFIILIYIYI